MDKIFLTAARKKIRFDSPKGNLTVEDLFDLPLTSTTGRANLDDIAKGLHRLLKDEAEMSFVDDNPKSDTVAALGFEIVKCVIATKKEEREAVAKESAKSATRQKIMALIDQKADAAMGEKSVEELTELLKSL